MYKCHTFVVYIYNIHAKYIAENFKEEKNLK